MHSHKNTQLVISVLTEIADQNKLSYKKVKKLFVVKGNLCITGQFWELLKKLHPDENYTEVYHCPDCDKFSLE